MQLVTRFTLLALVAGAADAQVASAILREDDFLTGVHAAQQISSIGNTASTQFGISALGLSSTGPAGTLSHFYVGIGAGGTIVRTEATFGVLEQTSFEGFFGLSDASQIAYSPSCNNTSTLVTGLDGVWLDDVILCIEDDPIPSLPGKVWRFGSRPGVTGNGIAYWVGGINDGTSGASEGGGLFFNDGGVETNVVKSGDIIAGLPALEGNAIDFDVRFSPDGSAWIGGLDTSDVFSADFVCALGDTGAGTVTPITAGGGIWKEAEPMTAAQGGLVGELWDNFDLFGITDSGDWMVTGDTAGDIATDEFIAVSGTIVYREGDVVDGETLTGSIDSAYLAADGQLAFVWDIAGAPALEALFLDDRLLLKEGDAVDWDGDGFVEADSILTDFTGISSLTAGTGGVIAFTADVDVAGTILEGYFVLDYECLSADLYHLSIAAGGSQVLSLDAGATHAGEIYLVAGSASGTTPGTVFQGFTIPLNLDAYFNSTIAQANTPGYMMTFGVLDAAGRATASINLPPGAPIPPGTTAHHAYAVFTLAPITLTKVSGAVSIATNP